MSYIDRRLAFTGIAVTIALFAMAAAPASAQTDFSLIDSGYSRSYFNALGSVGFDANGTNRTISLTSGVPLDTYLDTEGSRGFGGPGNSDPTVTFSGTVITPVTLGGVTHDVAFDYMVTPGGPTVGGPDFLDGSPVRFDFSYGYVTVTPLAEPASPIRFATFTFTAAPEPGSLALLGVAVLPLAGIIRRRKA